jgi:hypothetical protein
VFGTNPEYFFWTVLLTHLLNVGLLWYLVCRLTGSMRLACVGAALWGTCPLQEGALGWYAVYGHVVVATAMLAFLAQLTDDYARRSRPGRGALALWYALALVASMSFGTGIGIAMMFPLVIVLFLPHWRCYWRWPPLLSLSLVIPLLYIALQWIDQHFFIGPIAGGPVQVARVARANAPVVVQATLRLLAFGVERLLFGLLPLPVPTSMIPAYVMLALLAALVLAIVLRAPSTIRRQLGACALLTLAAYGMIALGRAALITACLPQQLGNFSRYHYTPLVPITLAFCILLNQAATAWRSLAALKNVALAAWLTLAAAAVLLSPPNINHHDKERLRTEQTVRHINAQIQAHKPGENVYLRSGPWQIFVGFFPANTVDGRRVYFISDQPSLIELRGRRTSTLFVTSEEVARDATAENR